MKVMFLDRDGTINVDVGHVHRIEDWQFTWWAIRAIKLLRGAGFAIAVVTNQSAIAAGRYAVTDVQRLHEQVDRQLASADACVDAWAFCSHAIHADCSCRKPRTGLAREIERQLGAVVDYPQSWMIGDKPSDVEFGQALGANTALLTSRYWTPNNLGCRPTLMADSLYAAARVILRMSKDSGTTSLPESV